MKPSELFMQRSMYCNMIYKRTKSQQVELRLSIIRYAQSWGIKPTSKKFGSSKNTVKKWLRRFNEKGTTGLLNQSQAPKNIPHKISKEEEDKIIQARLKTPCYGPNRLKWFYKLNPSKDAIYRVLKQNNLVKNRRKKHHTKQDLRAAKQHYKALSHHQEDVKHLKDQPYYWPQMISYNLPRYEYTIRDTKAGCLILAFGNRYNEKYSTMLTELYLQHLEKHGIPLDKVIIQTDNGTEFGTAKRNINTPGFVHTIEKIYGAKHNYIPPRMCNANADVESAHARIEEEFFNIEDFDSRKDFFIKAQAFQNFFNMIRPNYHKKGKTPLQIILEDRDKIDPNVVVFPVIDLDELDKSQESGKRFFKIRGQYLPNLPAGFL